MPWDFGDLAAGGDPVRRFGIGRLPRDPEPAFVQHGPHVEGPRPDLRRGVVPFERLDRPVVHPGDRRLGLQVPAHQAVLLLAHGPEGLLVAGHHEPLRLRPGVHGILTAEGCDSAPHVEDPEPVPDRGRLGDRNRERDLVPVEHHRRQDLPQGPVDKIRPCEFLVDGLNYRST